MSNRGAILLASLALALVLGLGLVAGTRWLLAADTTARLIAAGCLFAVGWTVYTLVRRRRGRALPPRTTREPEPSTDGQSTSGQASGH